MDIVLDNVRLGFCSRRRITEWVGVLVGVCCELRAKLSLYLNWLIIR